MRITLTNATLQPYHQLQACHWPKSHLLILVVEKTSQEQMRLGHHPRLPRWPLTRGFPSLQVSALTRRAALGEPSAFPGSHLEGNKTKNKFFIKSITLEEAPYIATLLNNNNKKKITSL